MREKVKGFWEKIKTFLKKLSKKVYIAAAIILAVLIVGLAAFVAARSRDYAVLVTGVSNQEAGAVLEFLKERGVSHSGSQEPGGQPESGPPDGEYRKVGLFLLYI